MKVTFAVYVLTPLAEQVGCLVTALVIVAAAVCAAPHLVQVNVAFAELVPVHAHDGVVPHVCVQTVPIDWNVNPLFLA